MTPHLLSRSRLHARLTENAEHAQAILLRAPAGYGKTVVVSQWLDKRDERSLWIDCSEADADTIWTYVAVRLSQTLDVEMPTPEFPLASVRGMIAGLEQPLTIVLDNYHLVTLPENDQLLAELAARTPQLTLVVLARRVRVLDGPIVTSRTPVAIFGPRDLAFTLDEAERLAAVFGRTVDDCMLASLREVAGWPLATRAMLGPSDAGSAADDAPGSLERDEVFDPRGQLVRFSLNHLEIVSETARRVVLAASLLDAVSFSLLVDFTGAEVPALRDAVHELVELGVLLSVSSGATTEFACHPAVRSTFALRSERSLSSEHRNRLLSGRAREIERSAPFTAFRLFCTVRHWPEAESVLARNFVRITAEIPEVLDYLRAIPDEALEDHPAFVSARLILESGDAGVPSSVIERLLGLLRAGLGRRVAEPRSATSDGVAARVPMELRLGTMTQHMVLCRLFGDLDTAYDVARDLETRIVSVPGRITDTSGQPAFFASSEVVEAARGLLAISFRELAMTALGVGDLELARRNWDRLLAYADAMIATPPRGLSGAQAGSVSDSRIGTRWRIAALNGMAFTEMFDGRMSLCAELLAESDRVAESSGERAPASTWVVGEVARAHLAYEQGDEELLRRTLDLLTPVRSRVEAWPLLLLGEAELVRSQRGAEWALTRLQTGMEHTAGPLPRERGMWRDIISCYRTMLCAALGDLPGAAAQLAELDETAPATRIERARLALFSLEDTQALLLSQQIGAVGTTVRQRTDHTLITAVAAWNCGRQQEAFEALTTASGLIQQHGLGSQLWSLPHDELHELAVAAREAGACDIVGGVEAVPIPARCRRYERLTEMELRTLQAIAVHRSISETADALFVTSATVKKHLNAVYRKLRARGREEAILQATRMGLLASAADSEA
ncbi:MAG: LuxR C-terminal-related transcriptional regulator [Leucobacter sp.]